MCRNKKRQCRSCVIKNNDPRWRLPESVIVGRLFFGTGFRPVGFGRDRFHSAGAKGRRPKTKQKGGRAGARWAPLRARIGFQPPLPRSILSRCVFLWGAFLEMLAGGSISIPVFYAGIHAMPVVDFGVTVFPDFYIVPVKVCAVLTSFFHKNHLAHSIQQNDRGYGFLT